MLLASAVSGNSVFQSTESATSIYIVASRETKAAQFANLNLCIMRQVYQQMVDTRSHVDIAWDRAISANTEGYTGSM